MNKNYNQVKREFWDTLFDSMKVLIAGFLIVMGFSFFAPFNLKPRVSWTFDITVFTLIISTIFSLIKLKVLKERTEIKTSLKNKIEDINSITLKENEPANIYCEILIVGRKSKLIGKNISISFPAWIQPQVMSTPYVDVNREINGIDIRLDKLFNQQDYVDLKETIPISIISNTPTNKKSVVKPELYKKRLQMLLVIKNTGIKIVNKE